MGRVTSGQLPYSTFCVEKLRLILQGALYRSDRCNLILVYNLFLFPELTVLFRTLDCKINFQGRGICLLGF